MALGGVEEHPERLGRLDGGTRGAHLLGEAAVGGHDSDRAGRGAASVRRTISSSAASRRGRGAWATSLTVEEIGSAGGCSKTTVTSDRNWLVLMEAASSHGPVDAKRYGELHELFGGASAGLVFVSCFPSRAEMRKHLADIAWETEVWCADAERHLIHFDGERFLGPYSTEL